MHDPDRRIAGIVLCGGRSSRMGHPKHLLPFGSETVLERVLSTLSQVVSHCVVVAAKGQSLPELDLDSTIVRDEDDYQGPLAGLLMGLNAVPVETELVYMTGCDVPLLKPEFVEQVIDSIGEMDVAMPISPDGFLHPLAGVYHTRIRERVEEMYAAGERRPRMLMQLCRGRGIPVDEFRRADPQLDSLQNMNRRDDYQRLLEKAGLSQSDTTTLWEDDLATDDE